MKLCARDAPRLSRAESPDDWHYGVEVDGCKALKGPPPPGLSGVTEKQLARRRDR